MIKSTDYLLQDFKVISQSISQISNSSDFLKIERNFCSDSSFESPLTHTIRRWWTLRNIQVIIIKPPGHPIWEWKLKLNWIDLGPSQKHLKIRSSLMTFNFRNFAFHIDSADSTRHNYSQQPQTTFDFFAWKTTFHNLFFEDFAGGDHCRKISGRLCQRFSYQKISPTLPRPSVRRGEEKSCIVIIAGTTWSNLITISNTHSREEIAFCRCMIQRFYGRWENVQGALE